MPPHGAPYNNESFYSLLITVPVLDKHVSAAFGEHCYFLDRRGILARAGFAEAFWLCSQSWHALDAMPGVQAAEHLMRVVTGCYGNTKAELDVAMHAVCAQFDGDVYAKVRWSTAVVGTIAEICRDLARS